MARWFAVLGVCLAALLVVGGALADGLDEGYGKSLPDFKHEGKVYKVLKSAALKGGEKLEIKNVVFEKNAKALLVGVGNGKDADLDMLVVDAQTGKEIGKDVLVDNVPVVQWMTGANNVVNILMLNSGKGECKFVLLANW